MQILYAPLILMKAEKQMQMQETCTCKPCQNGCAQTNVIHTCTLCICYGMYGLVLLHTKCTANTPNRKFHANIFMRNELLFGLHSAPIVCLMWWKLMHIASYVSEKALSNDKFWRFISFFLVLVIVIKIHFPTDDWVLRILLRFIETCLPVTKSAQLNLVP